MYIITPVLKTSRRLFKLKYPPVHFFENSCIKIFNVSFAVKIIKDVEKSLISKGLTRTYKKKIVPHELFNTKI